MNENASCILIHLVQVGEDASLSLEDRKTFLHLYPARSRMGLVLSKMQFRQFSRGSLVGQKQAYKPSPKTPQLLWGCSKITVRRMSLANPRGSPGISVIPESPKNIAKCIFKSAFLSTFGFRLGPLPCIGTYVLLQRVVVVAWQCTTINSKEQK